MWCMRTVHVVCSVSLHPWIIRVTHLISLKAHSPSRNWLRVLQNGMLVYSRVTPQNLWGFPESIHVPMYTLRSWEVHVLGKSSIIVRTDIKKNVYYAQRVELESRSWGEKWLVLVNMYKLFYNFNKRLTFCVFTLICTGRWCCGVCC